MGVNEDLHSRVSHISDVRISTNGTHIAMDLTAYNGEAVPYNPPSSSVGLHVFYPRESKCSKWWKRHFINNSTLSLLLFILFHDFWNLQKCWMYGCAFENVFTTSFRIAYTTCHLQGMKKTPRLR